MFQIIKQTTDPCDRTNNLVEVVESTKHTAAYAILYCAILNQEHNEDVDNSMGTTDEHCTYFVRKV